MRRRLDAFESGTASQCSIGSTGANEDHTGGQQSSHNTQTNERLPSRASSVSSLNEVAANVQPYSRDSAIDSVNSVVNNCYQTAPGPSGDFLLAVNSCSQHSKSNEVCLCSD